MRKTALWILMVIVLSAAVSAKTFTFEVGDYEIEDADGFEILNTENTELTLWDGDLVLVEAIFPLVFPDTQVVDEIRLIEFKDPVELELNIPSAAETDFMEFDYVERECFENTREVEFFVNDPIIMGNEATYSIWIYPLEVVDCEEGKFKLYQTVEYGAKIVESVSRIELVKVEGMASPGSTIPIKIFMNREVDGKLVIKDIIGEEKIASKTIKGDREIINLKLSDDFDREQYILEYIEDGKTVAYKDFIISTTWGSIDFTVHKSDDLSIIPIKVNITNNYDEEINVNGTLELINWDSEVTKTTPLEMVLAPGSNKREMDVTVSEEQQKDDIKITLEYEGHEESVTRNTMMRIDPAVAAWAKEQLEEDETQTSDPTAKSTIIAVIIAVVMFIIVGYVALKYTRKE